MHKTMYISLEGKTRMDIAFGMIDIEAVFNTIAIAVNNKEIHLCGEEF